MAGRARGADAVGSERGEACQNYCHLMRRGIIAVLGLASVGLGVWLIVTEHSRNAACNSRLGFLPGLSSNCQSVSWYYLGGFALVGLGVVTVVLSMMLNRRERRHRRTRTGPTELELRASVKPPHSGDQPPMP